ncbi:tol-pal system YbgF family protein [Deinococcus lacus]|uniref:Tol-pal system YbgF family protein n=1 Tax=Deinococcus lacus TaxID=392561 RepID=A0ABW1Y9M9_9DEIO
MTDPSALDQPLLTPDLDAARAALDAGQPLEAAALLEGHADPAARHWLGYAYVELARYDEARDLYRRLLEEAQAAGDPGAHRFLHQLGMVERCAGQVAAALRLFEAERAELARQGLGALERAVNGYELAVCLHALGEQRPAHAALAAAFADAQEADDPMTLGCLWRASGDFACAEEGDGERAHDAYTNARTAFEQAGDALAAAEMTARLAGKVRSD